MPTMSLSATSKLATHKRGHARQDMTALYAHLPTLLSRLPSNTRHSTACTAQLLQTGPLVMPRPPRRQHCLLSRPSLQEPLQHQGATPAARQRRPLLLSRPPPRPAARRQPRRWRATGARSRRTCACCPCEHAIRAGRLHLYLSKGQGAPKDDGLVQDCALEAERAWQVRRWLPASGLTRLPTRPHPLTVRAHSHNASSAYSDTPAALLVSHRSRAPLPMSPCARLGPGRQRTTDTQRRDPHTPLGQVWS